MDRRLRRVALLSIVLIALAVPIPAAADGFAACWVTRIVDPVSLIAQTVTRCRISGGDVVDYASDDEVPAVLYPNMGTDFTGQCWYLTSSPTQFVILARFADGSVEIGWDTDPGNPGGLVALGPVVPRCSSEPAPATDPSADAWDYVMAYIHPPPTPDLSPDPGNGITGLPTYVGVPVPPDHSATLTSGSTTLEVEISVDAVIVDWGDGITNTYPPMTEVLAGYPNGSARHTYETKTGEGAEIQVAYDWTARWRVVGSAWEPLPVPNTETTIDYPVAEVVARLTR